MVGQPHPPLNWPKTYQEAVALQEELRQRVRLVPLARPPRLVVGADAICNRADTRIFGAVAVYRYPGWELVGEAGVAGECPFPYRTGLLSFREVPILAAALARLKERPDVVLVDGQGLAHPRGLGLVADIPTIGVAKSRLVGEGQLPDLAAGSYNELILKGKIVGLILRTQTGRNPLYLSVGHRITLPECLEITLGCVTTYRLPVPVRQADLLSRRLRG